MKDYEKRGYLLENFRLFHLRSEGGARTDLHYHEFCKLILLLSGQGSYYIDGQHYLLCPGDIVLVGSQSLHKPELSDAAPYERIILYVSPEYLTQLSIPECDLLWVFRPEGGHVLRLPEDRRQKVFRMAAALEQDLLGDAFGREILSNAGLLRLLVELGRSIEDSAANLPRPSVPENRRVLEIMEYLDGNLSEEIDMDALAERFFISKYHMMRLFRAHTGFTIHTYLLQRRLLAARQLIERGMRATEACYRCGFRSYSSFTRSYGKYFGTTPTGRADTALIREEAAE